MRHKPIVGPQQYTPEWHALRKFDPDRKDRPVIFGSSEAAAACNASKYGSALELYLSKRGELEIEFTPEQQHIMKMGTRLEPVILDCYEDKQDCILERSQPLYFHPVWSFMAASPDAIARPRDRDRDDAWSVDAKSTNWRMLDKSGDDTDKFGEDGTDQVPMYCLMQSQVQMAVLGFDRCDFPVLVDGRKLRIYTVTRNEDLIKQIAMAEAELSERIIAGDPPEPNFEHTGTLKVLQKMFGHEVGKVAELSEEEHDLWIRKEHLSSTEKIIKEELDEIKARLLWSLGEAEIGRFPDATIEIKRTLIRDSFVTEKDVAELSSRVGGVKRAGFSLLRARKIG